MAQQTAVDFLIEQLIPKAFATYDITTYNAIQQAKQMEKVQILDAWEDGAQSEHRAHVNDKADKSSLDYYNETYKQQ